MVENIIKRVKSENRQSKGNRDVWFCVEKARQA